MKKQRSKFLVVLAVLFILGSYPAYRVYRVWYLNSRLERFMAQQIITLQEKNYDDEWFNARGLDKPAKYFVHRIEAYYIYGNAFIKDREGIASSFWISQQSGEKRVSHDEWNKELAKYEDNTLFWSYQIRPVSGPVVCVLITAHPPKSWTGPMHSLTGISSWSIDTSAPEWELTPHWRGPCEFRDTELLRTLLFPVQ
jgi:hypothetical protein